jgi:hypothetical protein
MIKRNFTAWDFVTQQPIEPWVRLGYTREYWEEWCGNTTTINGGHVTGGTLTFTDGDGYLMLDSTVWTIDTTNGGSNVIIGGSGNTVNGDNNIVLGGQNMTITADISDTTYVQNLSVGGTAEIPPTEGQMRTVMGEDGDWLVQTFITELENPDGIWITIRTEPSMITYGQDFVRESKWVRFKSWFGNVLS